MFLLILPIAAACARKEQAWTAILPPQVDRQWLLKETRALPNEMAPELIRSLGLSRATTATYEGNGHVKLRVFQMNGETGAFELFQKWRQTDGQAFYKGPIFVVAEPGGAERTILMQFLQALQREITPPA